MTAVGRPELALDLYTDEAILDPHPRYHAIRERAPAVWLPAHGAWALGRFEDVRAALRADDTLVSGRGVALAALVNDMPAYNTLGSDGEVHRRRRGVLIKPMMPSALAAARVEIESLARALVGDLAQREAFDGIADFARHLPVSVVSRLVGLPEAGRERMLAWAAATFDALGPANARLRASAGPFLEMAKYIQQVDPTTLRPEGWAAGLFAAGTEGRLAPGEVRGLLVDYVAPSLDTTILAAGHLLWLLGSHPGEWARVREHPDLIPGAVHEALRYEAPVRGFTRFAAQRYVAGEVEIPAGERVLVLYGSANRDERRYADPDRFDVTRDARDHLSYGYGVHRCAGGHLAQLELEALLRALVERVRTIDVGEPVGLLNNVLRGHASFRAAFR